MSIEAIKSQIERALADRCLSRLERDDILAAIRANGQITPEVCALWRQLQAKVFQGEIRIER